MRTKNVWIIAAVVLVAIGLVGACLSLSAMKFGLGGLSLGNVETVTREVTDPFTAVDIRVRTDDVTLLPSEDGACRVVLRENDRCRHEVAVQNGALTVTAEDHKRWIDFIGLFSPGTSVTVYLPAAEYAALTVDATTGDVDLTGLRFGEAEVTVTTGDVSVSSSAVAGALALDATTGDVTMDAVSCGSLVCTGSTGDTSLTDVIASGSICVERSTGDIRLRSCDAGSLTLETTTGSISGTLRTGKEFSARATTGSVHVPDSTPGAGRCELSSTTGSISIGVG